MQLFSPTLDYRRITDIPLQVMEQYGIKGLILDVDNTLTTHDNPTPLKDLDCWLDAVKEAGIQAIIVSNNHGYRVAPFAQKIGLAYVSEGKKPLTDGLQRAAHIMKLPKEKIAVIGDQIFTDILGGNLWGCTTILVEPIEMEKTSFFRLKRYLERPIVRHYLKNKR